ncbi:MAG: molybdopterin molybdotransferase MoeA [Anaerolineae bacterium]|nr:molybdopterin molybdotransferase MoeA [Anaerolineae bacterium]
MTELFTVLTPLEAWRRLREHLQPRADPEHIATQDALDRVLAAPLSAPHVLPTFPRATVDGYAVRAADTYGASASLPAYLRLAGEVAMGQSASVQLGPGQAVVVHTGGMIPPGADAAVMVEHTQTMDGQDIEVYRPVAMGENVIQIGEDVRASQALFPVGHRLRPQDIGGLLALGLTQVEVARRPRVAILSQGDEVVPPEKMPGPGQVRDVNSYTLAALARRAGGEPLLHWEIRPDHLEAVQTAAREARAQADLVVFTAGSSVSVRDMTAQVIGGLGAPGILVHGVSVKPGKPTILAVCDGKPVFGLPGNPVSAMVIFQLFVAPAIALFLGTEAPPERKTPALLARNVASQTGREDYVPVRLAQRGSETWAEPVFGKSNLIYTLVRADGLVQIPLDSNGLSEGEMVEVRLF